MDVGDLSGDVRQWCAGIELIERQIGEEEVGGVPVDGGIDGQCGSKTKDGRGGRGADRDRGGTLAAGQNKACDNEGQEIEGWPEVGTVGHRSDDRVNRRFWGLERRR